MKALSNAIVNNVTELEKVGKINLPRGVYNNDTGSGGVSTSRNTEAKRNILRKNILRRE